MGNPPPTDAEIDAWMDSICLAGVTNVMPEYLDWGISMPRLWVIGYTQGDGTKQYVTTTNDPTKPDTRTRVLFSGYFDAYQVNIRVYDNFFSIPPQPPAASVALPADQQTFYNNPANWAPAP